MHFLAIVLLVSLTFVPSAYADEMMDEALSKCDKNQHTLNLCARHFFVIADSELNELFKKEMSALDDAKAKERFRDAQRAWVVFRDKDCLFQVPTRDDSRTDWPMLYWACMKSHAQQRSIEIKYFIQCTYDNCFR